jgi:hypothetical protein
MKNLLAMLLCIGLLALFVVGFGFIETGGYEEVARGGTFEPEMLLAMFSPKHYRLTLIAVLVATLFAILDIQNLAWRVQTTNPNEPQPKSKPLAFVAVRARRYFIVPFVLAYVVVIIRTLGLDVASYPYFRITSLLSFGVLFLTARRPLESSITDAILFVMQMLAAMCQGFARGGH